MMKNGEISPKTGKRINAAVWISVIVGLLLFYVFGYFPLIRWLVLETSLPDFAPDWVGEFFALSIRPLEWLIEVFPRMESYYDVFG